MLYNYCEDEYGYKIEKEFNRQSITPTKSQVEDIRYKWYDSDIELSTLVKNYIQ